MNVKNRKVIRHLSYKTMLASKRRNIIAIVAIMLTTLLFTSLFTILLSMNSSYQTYQFKQVGGYAHGTFKEVTDEQKSAISRHKNVKETGERVLVGTSNNVPFSKESAEISYMDENCTKWSYANPKVGHLPEKENEILMDTRALKLLGVKPKIGATVKLSYIMCDKNHIGPEITDTFILSGYYEYDSLMPVHYINISKAYKDKMEQKAITELKWDNFRTDVNVMMKSSIDIRGQMEKVDTDLGYDWNTFAEENSVRIGVNWGYTSAQLDARLDAETIVAVVSFILLILLTGYLIIYNIFQISVAGDIRFYGLLKTIGVTPKQLRRIIRNQALGLCVVGVPAGMILGYVVGGLLTPVVIENSTLGAQSATTSTSPNIFIGSAVFSIITVLLSCAIPGRKAGKVSPIEATKYTENNASLSKKEKAYKGAKVYQMALANLGRSKRKTVLVLVSLSLAVVLLNILVSLVSGFDFDTYVSKFSCTDFVVSGTSYFRHGQGGDKITEEDMDMIDVNINASLSGCGYQNIGYTMLWLDEEVWKNTVGVYYPAENLNTMLADLEKRDDKIETDTQIEGIDRALLDKLEVYEGDASVLFNNDKNNIAVMVNTDDYGNIMNSDIYPKVGDTMRITYVDDWEYIDSRTGELCDEDTPAEYVQIRKTGEHDVEYTVCAWVCVPLSISYRHFTISYGAVLSVDSLRRDSGQVVKPLFYAFDTDSEESERAAEGFLSQLTASNNSLLMYESKETVRKEFEQFRQMFILMGGALCAIIAFVGFLNFFNAIMTGILARKKEFAVLQAVGMTGKQLKAMLVYEGMFYVTGLSFIALVVSLLFQFFGGDVLADMFWFYKPHFTILPVVILIPVFAILGWLIPSVMYAQIKKQSVIERLTE